MIPDAAASGISFRYKLQFVEQLHWRGSALAFPFGEGGPLAVEEVLPQYEFAESHQQNATGYRTSPAPCGGTLPKGEGIDCTINCNLNLNHTRRNPYVHRSQYLSCQVRSCE